MPGQGESDQQPFGRQREGPHRYEPDHDAELVVGLDELGLELMVGKNTAAFETPFTVSVDLIGHGCTTGISASDRAKTIKALVDPNIDPDELGKPGHIFPLKAKKGGVLRRAGHTEAAIDLARMAGLYPGGVLVEIMNEDGTMARLPDLEKVAKKFNLKLISIRDMIAYRMEKESLIEKGIVSVDMPTEFGDFKLTAYVQKNTGEHHCTRLPPVPACAALAQL